MSKKSRSGSFMNLVPKAYKQFFGLKIFKFFNPDPESGILLTLKS
jgi:hypothetical protein